MGFFSRASGPPKRIELPTDVIVRLEVLGKSQALGEYGDIGDLEYVLWTEAQKDPAQLAVTLRRAAEPRGGWAVYGAARALMSVIGPEFDNADYRSLLLDGLRFLREAGVAWVALAPVEMHFWLEATSREPW